MSLAAGPDPTPSLNPFNIDSLLGLDPLTASAEMEDHSPALALRGSSSSTATPTVPDNLPDKDDILVVRQTSSQRNKMILLVNEVPFYKAKTNKNGIVLFRCGGARFTASITTTADCSNIVHNNLKHCH